MSDDEKNEKNEKQRPSPTTSRPPGRRRPRPGPAGEARSDYTASAKWIVLRKKEKPAAEIFSVSYVAAGGDRRSAGHVRLQRRAGRIVRLPPHGRRRAAAGRLPVRRLAAGDASAARQNESSWLAFTDLVFVDPVGTGFSRVIENEKSGEAKEKKDERRCRPQGVLRLQARPRVAVRVHGPLAVRATAAGGRRSSSPARATAATGSGGSRGCCRRAPDRAERADPHLARARDHGARARPTTTSSGGSTRVPTMAAAAVHHGRSRAFPQGPPLDEGAARGRGRSRPATTRRSSPAEPRCPRRSAIGILTRLADSSASRSTSLSAARGGSRSARSSRELLRDERKVLGLYDATITATDPFPDRDRVLRARSHALRA